MAEPSLEQQRAYVLRWQETGQTLARRRRAEVAALSDEDALRAVHDLLEALDALPPREPRPSSGLVEMQRVLARARIG